MKLAGLNVSSALHDDEDDEDDEDDDGLCERDASLSSKSASSSRMEKPRKETFLRFFLRRRKSNAQIIRGTIPL